jgi:hypothetical protein
MSGVHHDGADMNYGFRVDFTPGAAADKTEGKWRTFEGGGLLLHESNGVTRGTDSFTHHTLGTCEWQDIRLTGFVTAARKDMLQWYQDMVQKGGEAECFRDVTLTWLKRDGTDGKEVTWHECFLTSYALTALDGECMNENSIETIEICTGYSSNYLG